MEEKNLISEQDRLLINYLTGEATEEERASVTNWIHQSPENSRYFQEYREVYIATKLSQTYDTELSADAWEKVKTRHYMERGNELQRRTGNTITEVVRDIFRYAAFIALALSIGYTGFRFFKNKVFTASSEIWNTVEAPYGSRTHLTLADGSEVWLNAGSNLKYSTQFGHKNRRVILDGEAYFEVHKDSIQQFVVSTSYLDIKVFGTEFNVKAYSGEDNIQTTLVNGSVTLEGKIISEQGNRSVTLEPNQTATFFISEKKADKNDILENLPEEAESVTPAIKLGKAENLIITPDINTLVYTSWKDPMWVFESESLLSLATKFERRYNIKFVFESKDLQNYKFTGALKDETLEQVLNVLILTLPVDYRIENNRVVLSENKYFKNSYDDMLIRTKR